MDWQIVRDAFRAHAIQESWWSILATAYNLFSDACLRAFSSQIAGALARCTLGESERSQSWNVELYYHRKLNQIKHCKQNSGEDQAVSLPLVADTSVAGMELQWSVSVSIYESLLSYQDSNIPQWWMRSNGVQQKKKKDNIKILVRIFSLK